MPLPRFPPKPFEDFPKPPKMSKVIKRANPLREIIQDARDLIKSGHDEISNVASALRVEGAEEPEKVRQGGSTGVVTKTTPTITTQELEPVATACVPCAVGHFSTSAGLLKEAARFKGEGITSNEILNRIAMALEEQNTLERVDLRPEEIQSSLPWERDIAEEALSQSRGLRHRLESIESVKDLEQAAADSETTYKKLFREWFKRRFAHLGPGKAQSIAEKVGRLSPEDKERVLRRAEELVEEA